MPICNIIETPGRTPEQVDQIEAHLRTTGPTPPEGCRLVVRGLERVVTVWDAVEDRDRFFTERLGPAYEATGLSLDDADRAHFDVDMIVAGDLVGTVAA
jgi:hypothetical protein